MTLPFIALLVHGMSFESKNREYYHWSKYAGGGIDEGHSESVFATIVLEVIVWRVRDYPAEAEAEWEKDLCGSVAPHVRVFQLFILKYWQ